MDLERAISMLQALPHTSKTIVDDTLYEKVYSFITSVLESLDDNAQAIVDLFQQSRFLECVKQACLIDPEPDYRIITLCIRLLGQFVHHGRDPIFTLIDIDDNNTHLLKIVIDGLTSSEPILRFSCLEACRHFLWCEKSQLWLMRNQKVTTLIAYAILDQSTYVVAEACHLFSDLLQLDKRETMLQLVDPSDLIRSILYQQDNGNATVAARGENEQQVISALDFCWSIVNLKSHAGLEYLRSRHLLKNILQLIPMHQNKIIRARINEILLNLFTYDDNPLETIFDVANSTLTDAYNVVLELVTKLMPIADVELLITAVSLLNSTAILLGRISSEKANSSKMSDILHDRLYTLLHTLYSIVTAKEQQTLLSIEFQNVKTILEGSTTRSKNRVLQQILRVMNTLVTVSSASLKELTFTDFFSILSATSTYSDSSLLKEIFKLLTAAMCRTYDKTEENLSSQQRQIYEKSIQPLITTISRIDLGCKSFIIVLNLFSDLLEHKEFEPLVIDAEKAFMDILKLKFIDTEWDIRDAAVQFVGQLFDKNEEEDASCSGTTTTKGQFALKYDFPFDVVQRIHDSEPYVRASALDALQKMIRSREGWEYIQQHKVSRDIASALPSFLYDTEAFVRRAALDAINSLVQNRSCQGMIVGKIEGSHAQSALSPFILRKVLNDEDTDVRSKLCRLIGNLWKLYYHEKHESRKKTQEHEEMTEFFPKINPGKMLTEAVKFLSLTQKKLRFLL
ncbi:armadillo-type protein [Mycotypha africana]|uniref:armadillo-type protein n=1 Tax=Mycotypha africana TaxID=64632 RepID=UPI002301018C|nr:armadillo-type protein [Mycotypha africana]KAI8991810.1 armadillo-type protein [Mycotypha africana]